MASEHSASPKKRALAGASAPKTRRAERGDPCCRPVFPAPLDLPAAAKDHGPEKVPVYLSIYDLGHVSRWTLNSLLPPKNGAGVFHCGVEVIGFEFSFEGIQDSEKGDAMSGLTWHKPRSHPRHVYRESVFLGNSGLTAPEVVQLLRRLEHKWLAFEYHFLSRNCTDFAQEFATQLRTQEPLSFPTWVHGLAKVILRGGVIKADAPKTPAKKANPIRPLAGVDASPLGMSVSEGHVEATMKQSIPMCCWCTS